MAEIPWSLDPELREILVCPACRGPLTDVPDGLGCPACHLLYPVIENIPHLIAEDTRPFSPTEPA